MVHWAVVVAGVAELGVYTGQGKCRFRQGQNDKVPQAHVLESTTVQGGCVEDSWQVQEQN